MPMLRIAEYGRFRRVGDMILVRQFESILLVPWLHMLNQACVSAWIARFLGVLLEIGLTANPIQTPGISLAS